MRIDEIQVEDWVNIKDPYGRVRAVQVKNIYGDYFNLMSERDEKGIEKNFPGYYIGNASPIPITKEILEKIGFDIRNPREAKILMEDGNTTVINITVKFCREDLYLVLRVFDQYQKIEMKIQFVHELQHAIKLMKIDKDIIL